MVHIRRARKDDIPHLAQAYVAAYTHARVGEHWDTVHATKLLTHFQRLQPNLFFIALIDTIPAGAVVGVSNRGGMAIISQMENFSSILRTKEKASQPNCSNISSITHVYSTLSPPSTGSRSATRSFHCAGILASALPKLKTGLSYPVNPT